MKSFLLLLTVYFFISGCSKQQTVIRKLDGNWEIVLYKQTYINNLTSIIDSEGTFTFESYKSRKEESGSFAYQQSYTLNGTTTNVSETGKYALTKKAKNIFVNIINSDGTYQDARDYAIEIITTTDLKMTVVFDDVFHTYVLRKI